ncbi:class I SAM-dependent methyltransferase [Brevundimonas sp. A19_0]|uniref:class I SAM-dependent methyltransferase n=1 Tax=Brevundimonas sp. A19_0 TaxID=2821087 RepID=UPI001ADC0D36|nr:class I SAM-dependent methyltransferase [Brevundimonas sp. A19_0]MBO9500288.1 class I SAM-dependent methyltransferase [Brevundimonas sp. A19_0]
MAMIVDSGLAGLSTLIDTQLRVFPAHAAYLEKRFAGDSAEEMALADDIAARICQIAGDDLETYCRDYAWLSEIVLEEELFFRRNGRYRLTTFQEAYDQVYSQREYMSRYMNGLLMSQVWWRNHTAVMGFYRDAFLGGFKRDFSHLEVGPGHGLLLGMATRTPHCVKAEGWDISEASLANTQDSLRQIGADISRIDLKRVDIFDAPDVAFDAVVFSEVLEHLEQPLEAVRALYQRVRPGGRIFINAPVNSPAPDHLYLFSNPEQVVDMVQEGGFEIEQTLFAPCTGATLDRARRLGLTISVAVIGTKPE